MFTTVFADDRGAIQALLEGVLGHDSFEEKNLVAADDAGKKLTYRIHDAASD